MEVRRRWYAGIIAMTCNFYAPDCVYVEIGVARGRSINRIAPNNKEAHAVDPDPAVGEVVPDGVRFWNMPSDEFFEAYDGPAPTVIFIDGDHAYEQAKRDLDHSLAVLVKGGAVFLHDTWPRTEADAGPDRCGTVWRLAEEIAARADLESYTWPRYPGLTVVRRRGEGFDDSEVRGPAPSGS